jgi:hypothetical protein
MHSIAGSSRCAAPLPKRRAATTRPWRLARALAAGIAETAQAQFDVRSERWQDGETGTRVRSWIEAWEMSLDELDLALPEPLEALDPDLHAGEIEDAPATPTELEDWLRHDVTLGLRR